MRTLRDRDQLRLPGRYDDYAMFVVDSYATAMQLVIIICTVTNALLVLNVFILVKIKKCKDGQESQRILHHIVSKAQGNRRAAGRAYEETIEIQEVHAT
jgi:hypothetical protein